MNIPEKIKEIDEMSLTSLKASALFRLMSLYFQRANEFPAIKVSEDLELFRNYYNQLTA